MPRMPTLVQTLRRMRTFHLRALLHQPRSGVVAALNGEDDPSDDRPKGDPPQTAPAPKRPRPENPDDGKATSST